MADDYAAALASGLRTIAGASPELRLKVLANVTRELAGYINKGGLDKGDVVDRVWQAADANGTVAAHGEDVVQRAIAEGLEIGSVSQCPTPYTCPAGTPAELGRDFNGVAVPSAVPAVGHLGHPVTALDVGEFLARKFPPREQIFAPWLPTQGIAMIHAPRGIGKTHVALGTAWAIHVGAGFLRWTAPRPWRVLLLDGEMPAVALQGRLERIAEVSEHPAQPANLKIAAADLTRDGLPDLSDPAAQRFYAKVVDDADVVIVDNVSTLCRTLKENDADSWTPVQQWALTLRRAGKSVVLIHHAGKTGTQRGTSRKEDVLDTVIGLRRPPDFSPDQGARFEVHYEKSRGFYGVEAEPFEAWLIGNQWRVARTKAGDDAETIKKLHEQGLSIRNIAERTGLSKSNVQRKLDEDDEDKKQ